MLLQMGRKLLEISDIHEPGLLSGCITLLGRQPLSCLRAYRAVTDSQYTNESYSPVLANLRFHPIPFSRE